MSLTHLLIHDFHNIETTDLTLSPSFNFLVGANSSGKTSMLEAIYTLSHGQAFHSLQIGHIIHHEQEAFVLHRQLQGKEHKTAIGLTKDKQGNSKVHINSTDRHKVTELAHLMPMQLITPEGFTLLNSSPKYRRAFLNWGCFHNKPRFFTTWSNLKQLLKQHNAALHQVTHYKQLHPWDKELIPLAEQISTWRTEYSTSITANMADTCKQFLPEFSLTFSFQHSWEKETEYAEVLEHNFEHNHQLTYTTHSPHKADLHIHTNSAPVEDTLSRGQLKLLMCTLHLAQGEFLTHESRQQCLYLIDDFASELDDEHHRLLASHLKATQSQVFVSTISAEHIIDMSDKNSKMFTMEKGKITD